MPHLEYPLQCPVYTAYVEADPVHISNLKWPGHLEVISNSNSNL